MSNWEDDIYIGDRKKIYIFINDDNKKFYRSNLSEDGSYSITLLDTPYPIKTNPINLLQSKLEFATTRKYFSMNRSISFPLEFIKDGAAILRHLYYNGKGIYQNAYITILEYNPDIAEYDLSYKGKIAFQEKEEEPKTGKFIVPTKDDSAWGVLSENDTTEYSVDCTRRNRKAIPVLIDGITLINKFTFQTVLIGTNANNYQGSFTLPFVLANQDGDSSGILTKNQSMFRGAREATDFLNTTQNFLETLFAININITGTFSFTFYCPTYFHSTDGTPAYSDSPQVDVYFLINDNTRYYIFQNLVVHTGERHSTPISLNIGLSAGAKVFLMFTWHDLPNFHGMSFAFNVFTPDISNIFVTTNTKPQPTVVYGVRALDFAKEIVNKATDGRYSINSKFFTENNNDILIAGDSARQSKNARLYSSFADFFDTFDAINFLAIRDILGELWIEKATEVYKSSSPTAIIDLGEIIDIKLSPATDYFANEVEVGSPKKDFRHPSGRLEFNSTNTFSLEAKGVKKKLSKVSKYNLGSYDLMFQIMDYVGGSTKDNQGDKSVYVAEITNDLDSAIVQVETFENITIDSAILEPIIKSPFTGDVLTYPSPFIRGIATPTTVINIYVDNGFDGTTTSDSNGNWSYQISINLSTYLFEVRSGTHIIEATFGNNGDPKSSISVTIDTTTPTPLEVVYPSLGENLYNSSPLIEGVGQAGTVFPLTINGNSQGNISVDNSGKWFFKATNLPNGFVTVNTGFSTMFFEVNNAVTHPLITYVGSELDGFTIINNLPIVKGVAKPGEVVTLWLNYITYASLGTATADSNGNWSFQVVPKTYTDPLSHALVALAPIRNGISVISTSLVNATVPVVVVGYKLNRPVFDTITGVTDNSVFNTSYSPKRMLQNQYPLISSMLQKTPNAKLFFQTADKNGNLSTTLAGVTITENSDVLASEMGDPIAMLEEISIKTIAKKSFIKTLQDFNNGGIIKAFYRGHQIDMLPIGGMKLNNIVDTVQDWKLLLAPTNSFATLLNLFNNGIKITLMSNQIYHSYFNSLHMVAYDFHKNPKFNTLGINEDWFENRNEQWTGNPIYIQKYQTTDIIVNQIITNGISGATLRMFKCSDGLIQNIFTYQEAIAPVPSGYTVLETTIDFSLFPEDQYFFVLVVAGTPIMISERVETKSHWPKTFLLVANSTSNEIGAYFSTGFKTIIRVEGTIKKLRPDLSIVSSRDNEMNSSLLYGNVSRKREVRFGTAYGLPDYLYLKIADALAMDNLIIEGVNYVLRDGSTLKESDDIDGHPLYYYTVELDLRDNKKGAIFTETTLGQVGGSVVITVNAAAFGLPSTNVINIELEG